VRRPLKAGRATENCWAARRPVRATRADIIVGLIVGRVLGEEEGDQKGWDEEMRATVGVLAS